MSTNIRNHRGFRWFTLVILAAALVIFASLASARAKTNLCKVCPVSAVKSHATNSLGEAQSGGTCSTGKGANGYPIPDPKCTPGAYNPTVTPEVFGSKKFTTKCVRDCLTTGAEKKKAYQHYRIKQNSSCELDHLVPLEMGGADSLDNIWPQCGKAPNGKNYKDIKDSVEQYLAIQVVLGKKDWETARASIAKDWTQFIAEEETFCATNHCDIADYRK